jgi:CDP-diacylglycerol--serine O-phosphatidyltransferase
LTIGNILLGFYAMVAGLRGDYQTAVISIFLAAVLDSLDGRFARAMQIESDFGREYDSLADVITFGVAPALLAYSWEPHDLGRLGWLLPLFFLVCTATRLARFNVQTRVADRRFFVGLPAPAAAGALCSLLYFAVEFDLDALGQALLLASAVLLGLLMVSTFRYYSFKELDPRRRWSFRVVLPIAAVIVLLTLYPAAVFLVVSGSYALSGPLLFVHGALRRRRDGGPGPDPERADAESTASASST